MKKAMTKKASVKKVTAYKKGGVKKMGNGGSKAPANAKNVKNKYGVTQTYTNKAGSKVTKVFDTQGNLISQNVVKKGDQGITRNDIKRGVHKAAVAIADPTGIGRYAVKKGREVGEAAKNVVKTYQKGKNYDKLSKIAKAQQAEIKKLRASKGSSGDDKMTGLQFNPYKGTSGKSSGTKKTTPVKKTAVGTKKPTPVKANVPSAREALAAARGPKGQISMGSQATTPTAKSTTPASSGKTAKELRTEIRAARKEKGVLSGMKAKMKENKIAKLEKRLDRIKGTEMKKGGVKKATPKKMVHGGMKKTAKRK